MSSLVVDEAPSNGVDAVVKPNGVTESVVAPTEPVATPAVPDATSAVPEAATSETTSTDADAPSTSDAAAKTEDEKKADDATKKEDEESEEDKEIKARKKELDALNEAYKDVPHGSKPELVHLDKRWDKNGDEYYIRQKKAEPRVRGEEWWCKHVLVVIRHFDEDEPEKERVEQTTVESKVIALTLPSLSTLSGGKTLAEGSDELVHMNILLNFIETQFANTIEQVNNLRPQNLVSYDTLWTLFRPGTIMHSKIRGYDRAFKVESYYTVMCGQHVGFYSLGTFMDYDGKNFGKRTERLKIPPFAGSAFIPSLPFAPLDMRTRKDDIHAALMKRGERFHSMRGQCHGEYVGVAIEQGHEPTRNSARPEDEEMTETLFWAEDSMSAEEFAAFKAKLVAEKAARGLTEEETLLTTNILRGFSFTEKQWFQLFIENYSDIASFDRLVLPDASKSLIRALVSSHLRVEDDKFDDIIKGKGTRPRHRSARFTRCRQDVDAQSALLSTPGAPCMLVSSGDLGTSASHLERELTRILDLAHTWRAVLLIDEADVFLEKRTLTDVHRNALVSVFLRLLEYYEGILFLTTNRVNTFDGAFQRSQAPLEGLFEQAHCGAGADVTEEGYDALSKYDINGGKSKTPSKLQRVWHRSRARGLNLEYLETVLKTQADFAEAFEGNQF
ncbi:AAA family ATPase [Favolaschia claudopus]|uniref:AAA family ATPase n=1 Tax=Favolaschia claudopus TaxID=2862362 RepID=A0AAW0B0I3_9AGAR